MQFTGVPQVVAPLATGHPLGLPGAPVRTTEETKVQPVKEQPTTDTDHAADQRTGGQTSERLWRSLAGPSDPAGHAAPPSMMQIRISALLEEQAEVLLKELRKNAVAQSADRSSDRQQTDGSELTQVGGASQSAEAPQEAAPDTAAANSRAAAPALPEQAGTAGDRPAPPPPETAPSTSSPRAQASDVPPGTRRPEATPPPDAPQPEARRVAPPPEPRPEAVPERGQGADSPPSRPQATPREPG